MTEDEMVGWHHRLNGHEYEQIPGDSGGQESLTQCCSLGHRQSDTTEQLTTAKLSDFFPEYSMDGGLTPQQGYMADTIHQPWDQKVKVKVAHLLSTLCDPMDYVVYEILQARVRNG